MTKKSFIKNTKLLIVILLFVAPVGIWFYLSSQSGGLSVTAFYIILLIHGTCWLLFSVLALHVKGEYQKEKDSHYRDDYPKY